MGSEIIASLFAITKYSLGIYSTKKAREYLDRVIYLEKVYYAEENKPEDQRNHAIMDNVTNELCLLTNTITRFKEQGT
jgi:hypothetical protein